MHAPTTSHTLRSRILRASTWTLIGHAAGQIIRLGSNLILTRLLVPEMFGVMALANVIIIGLHLFSDVGLKQGIIQSQRGNDPVYLNTVWTMQIIRGGMIWLTAIGIAGGIHLLSTSQMLPESSVYVEPILPYVIGVLSFNALINGFASTLLATANRNLAIARVVFVELGSQVAALALMLGWALVAPSIWALVAGTLFDSLLRAVLSHTLLPGERNALQWDRKAFWEIVSFGKWILLTSILGFAAANGDRLMLGGLVDAATLGLYAIALSLVNALREAFERLSADVAFPALSEVVRERPLALKSAYYKLRLPLDLATLPATGLLFSAGHLLIDILYDDRYRLAGHIVEILSVGLFVQRFSLAWQCFIALGMPKLMAPAMTIQLIILFAFTPVAYSWLGLDGALWAIVASELSVLPLTFYYKIKYRIVDHRKEIIVLPLVGLGYMTGEVIKQIAI